MRYIVGNVQATGPRIKFDDRAISVGLIEVRDGVQTGRTWQTFLNPEGKKSSWHSSKRHHIKDDFLLDKPLFREVYTDMLDFIDGDPVLSHGAYFSRDAIINEFRVSGLEIPVINFFDTIRIAETVITDTKMNLYNVAEILEVEVPCRNTQGILDEVELLCMILEAINDESSGAVEQFIKMNASLDNLPNFMREAKIKCEEKPLERPSGVSPLTVNTSLLSKASDIDDLLSHDLGSSDCSILNPGVSEVILKLNATTGPMNKATKNMLRTGGADIFTNMTPEDLARECLKRFPKADIISGIKGLPRLKRLSGLRWIARGLKPERWRAFKMNSEVEPPEQQSHEKETLSVSCLRSNGIPVSEIALKCVARANEPGCRYLKSRKKMLRVDGNDLFSTMNRDRVLDFVLDKYDLHVIENVLQGLNDRHRISALRWIARGVKPEAMSRLIDHYGQRSTG